MCPIYADEIDDDVTTEYIDEYNENEAEYEYYDISYEDYANQRTIDDYGI
jgi:hypothetical protein